MQNRNSAAIEKDPFFTQTDCDRCAGSLEDGRTMSWFNHDCICMTCSGKERELRGQLREAGFDDLNLEGCGYIPTVEAK